MTGVPATPPRWSTTQVVLFGGAGVGDTWEYGTTWTERVPATSPSPRAEHAMVYDERRRRVVLIVVYLAGGHLLRARRGHILAALCAAIDMHRCDGWSAARVTATPGSIRFSRGCGSARNVATGTISMPRRSYGYAIRDSPTSSMRNFGAPMARRFGSESTTEPAARRRPRHGQCCVAPRHVVITPRRSSSSASGTPETPVTPRGPQAALW